MIGDQYTVIVRRAVLHAGTYSILIIRDHGVPEMVADALEIGDAMHLGVQVRTRLDQGDDIAGIRLALASGGVPA